MPTYEYVCEACGKTEDRFFTNPNESPKIIQCVTEDCSGIMHRQISAGAGVLFRGSGFYCTDYRKGAPPKEESPKKKDVPKK